LKKIVGNIDVIININSALLQQLEQSISGASAEKDSIGTIFLRLVTTTTKKF